jgi:hypothetical protein
MDNLSEIREYATPPSEQVGKFVTRIWEHPLVDQETRNHRELAKAKLVNILSDFGVDTNSFITIPVGSLIWATDSQSDYDYQLVFGTKEQHRQALDTLKPREKEFFERLKQEKAKVIPNFPVYADDFVDPPKCANFLFTPDEYIGGNIQLARDLRKKAVERMKYDDYTQSDWEFVVGSRFEIFFTKWDDLSLHLSWQYKDKKDDAKRDRTRRIEERLKLKSQQSHNPSLYMKRFNEARQSMHIPDLRTYSEAINSSSGALHISPKYAAIGIDPGLIIKHRFSFFDLFKR